MIRQMLELLVLEHPLWFPMQCNIILAAISCTAKKTYGKRKFSPFFIIIPCTTDADIVRKSGILSPTHQSNAKLLVSPPLLKELKASHPTMRPEPKPEPSERSKQKCERHGPNKKNEK